MRLNSEWRNLQRDIWGFESKYNNIDETDISKFNSVTEANEIIPKKVGQGKNVDDRWNSPDDKH